MSASRGWEWVRSRHSTDASQLLPTPQLWWKPDHWTAVSGMPPPASQRREEAPVHWCSYPDSLSPIPSAPGCHLVFCIFPQDLSGLRPNLCHRCVHACMRVRAYMCVCVCACVRVCVLGRVYTIARPAKDQSFFFFLIKKNNFLFCIEVELINNVVMVSGEQERDSAILIHVSILPHTYLPSIQATTQHWGSELLPLSRARGLPPLESPSFHWTHTHCTHPH